MEKKPRVPVLLMRVGGFGCLPSLFNFGMMHAVVTGKEVASYSFEHKKECKYELIFKLAFYIEFRHGDFVNIVFLVYDNFKRWSARISK